MHEYKFPITFSIVFGFYEERISRFSYIKNVPPYLGSVILKVYRQTIETKPAP